MARTQQAAARVATDIASFRTRERSTPGGSHSYVTLLGLKTFDTLKLLERVTKGLPYSAFERLQRNIDLSSAELAKFVQIKPRTLMRRKGEGRFQPAESDRLLRASRIFGRTLELYEGDADAARAWLAMPLPALGGAAPIVVARTEVGAREVEDLIGRLEHGVFS